MIDYTKQANDFCEKYGIKITRNFIDKRANKDWDDSYERNLWEFTIKKGRKSYKSEFWDSVANSNHIDPVEPSNYDLLACLTKYDPGTFEDFCVDFGYNTDSRKAEKTYKAVVKEYESLCRVFGDDPDLWEEFREIA